MLRKKLGRDTTQINHVSQLKTYPLKYKKPFIKECHEQQKIKYKKNSEILLKLPFKTLVFFRLRVLLRTIEPSMKNYCKLLIICLIYT